MANLVYKQTTITTKKLARFYDAEKHSIDVDGVEMDVLDALKVFNGVPLELVVKVKEETDLLDE